MPTFTGRYTLEFECQIDSLDGKAAYQELHRHIGLKNQSGKVLSVIRNDLAAEHVCLACEAEKVGMRASEEMIWAHPQPQGPRGAA